MKQNIFAGGAIGICFLLLALTLAVVIVEVRNPDESVEIVQRPQIAITREYYAIDWQTQEPVLVIEWLVDGVPSSRSIFDWDGLAYDRLLEYLSSVGTVVDWRVEP